MRACFITFRSVTYAQRADAVLRRGGIDSSLQRTPRWMEEQGCGYCLRVAEREATGAVVLLRGAKVPMRKVYRILDGGRTEELEL